MEFSCKDSWLRAPVEVGIGYIRGKRYKLRTVPIASWVKVLVDSRTTAAGITSGLICRRASWGLNKFEVSESGLSEP